jgi:NAD(P)H dehydrogenase (quinone)
MLKQFIDTTGPLWLQGKLANKPVTSFTSSINRHGGQESTILALNNVFYHWGALIVPPGYTDPLLYASGGNPYGTSMITGQEIASELPSEIVAAARYQGRRVAEVKARLTS